MVHEEKLLDVIARLPSQAWEGTVYRHMFARYLPDVENTIGARWNPPEVPAIYASLSRKVALAEAEHQIQMQPNRPKARRTIYKISVRLANVVDISPPRVLEALGLTEDDLTGIEHAACQRVGGAVHHLGHDGMVAPSARLAGLNLAIYPNRTTQNYRFEILDAEVVDPGATW